MPPPGAAADWFAIYPRIVNLVAGAANSLRANASGAHRRRWSRAHYCKNRGSLRGEPSRKPSKTILSQNGSRAFFRASQAISVFLGVAATVRPDDPHFGSPIEFSLGQPDGHRRVG